MTRKKLAEMSGCLVAFVKKHLGESGLHGDTVPNVTERSAKGSTEAFQRAEGYV
jgi:hypothetical protein